VPNDQFFFHWRRIWNLRIITFIILPEETAYNEREMLLRIAKGDKAAFAGLFLRFRDRIYTTALRMTESAVEAEEVVQDVFVKIWMKREELAGIENLEAYVYTMGKNYTYNALKRMVRERKQANTPFREKEFSVPEAEQALNAKELNAILQTAINRLPLQQRAVYLLAKNEELTKAEIAEKLQISPHTVKTHYDTAVRAVRAYCIAFLKIYLLVAGIK
jgi:RNA polymerase sigma-70 factor (ECF subfamily)